MNLWQDKRVMWVRFYNYDLNSYIASGVCVYIYIHIYMICVSGKIFCNMRCNICLWKYSGYWFQFYNDNGIDLVCWSGWNIFHGPKCKCVFLETSSIVMKRRPTMCHTWMWKPWKSWIRIRSVSRNLVCILKFCYQCYIGHGPLSNLFVLHSVLTAGCTLLTLKLGVWFTRSVVF
jgi:hypothetical protein